MKIFIYFAFALLFFSCHQEEIVNESLNRENPASNQTRAVIRNQSVIRILKTVPLHDTCRPF